MSSSVFNEVNLEFPPLKLKVFPKNESFWSDRSTKGDNLYKLYCLILLSESMRFPILRICPFYNK